MPKRKLSDSKVLEKNSKRQKIQTNLPDLPEDVLVKILLLDCNKNGFTLLSRLIKIRQVCRPLLHASGSKKLWRMIDISHGLSNNTAVRDAIVHFMPRLGSHTHGIALNGHAGRLTIKELNELFGLINPLRAVQLSNSVSIFSERFLHRTLWPDDRSIEHLSVVDCRLKMMDKHKILNFLSCEKSENLKELIIKNTLAYRDYCIIRCLTNSCPKWTCSQNLTRLELVSSADVIINLMEFCAATPNLKTLKFHGLSFQQRNYLRVELLDFDSQSKWADLTDLELSFFRRLPEPAHLTPTKRLKLSLDNEFAGRAGQWIGERAPSIQRLSISTNADAGFVQRFPIRSYWLYSFTQRLLSHLNTEKLGCLTLARIQRQSTRFQVLENATMWKSLRELTLDEIDLATQNCLLDGIGSFSFPILPIDIAKLEKLSILHLNPQEISEPIKTLARNAPDLCDLRIQGAHSRAKMIIHTNRNQLLKALGALPAEGSSNRIYEIDD